MPCVFFARWVRLSPSLSLALTLSFLAGGFISPLGAKLSAEETAPTVAGGEVANVARVVSGPWGDLQCFETNLVAPRWMVETFELPSATTIWRFPGWSVEQLSATLSAMPFTAEQFQWTREPNRGLILDDEIRLHPPDEFLIGMNGDQRRAIHRILSRYEENEFHFRPVSINAAEAKSWFRSAGLSGNVADLIESLCYENSGDSVFTEIEFVLKQLGSRESEYRFIRALTRTRCLIARLCITEQTDLNAVAEYWQGHGKHKVITPILEAVNLTKGVDHLDILHLLPPTPRKLLNTFPDLTQARTGKFPDGRWIAANFFRFEPSDRFHDSAEVSREIETMYRAVEGEPKFGDLMMVLREGSAEPILLAIHIAGDIVYAKSGGGIFSPFILTTIPELLRAKAKGEQKVFVKTLRHRMAE